MFVLCAILGALQYRWIGQVSVAERDRLHQRLQTDLNRLSQDFNNEFTSACRALAPSIPAQGVVSPAELSTRYQQWSKSGRHSQLFRAVGLAIPNGSEVELHIVNLESGEVHGSEWPSEWESLRDRMESRLAPRDRHEWGRGNPGARSPIEAHLTEVPLFAPRGGPGGPMPRGPFGRSEAGWLIVDLNLKYVGESLLPELTQRYLGGTGGGSDYLVDVVSRTNPPAILYESTANSAREIGNHVDASVGLFDVQFDQIFPRPEPPGGRGPFNRMPQPDNGRWQLNVRNRAGSLEAVVASTRLRSLAVTAAILLLLIATAGALLRYTRRAQRLARLQMDFVAGISHELRTPLAVIYGAAYNLRGSVARNPEQVEKYGVLLQQETSRLRDLVEQVLRFSGAQAGRVVREREPVAIDTLIDQTLDSVRSITHSANCRIEKNIDPQLPLVLGDAIALKHAIQNLVANAAKYGRSPNGAEHWIGITASTISGKREPSVEIRVADHGPGVPTDEIDHVFDAFFRGRRAIQEQIHGTGLGLNLVKKIVEAHGGTIRVESDPMKLTEFIVRLPAAVGVPEMAGADIDPVTLPSGRGE
jgi:signal transduction histidine kinase